MNTRIRLPIATLVLALAAAGCNRNDAVDTTTTPATPATMAEPAPASTAAMPASTGTMAMPSTSAYPSAAAPAAGTPADSTFLSESMTANENEIAITALAMDKGGAEVKTLATMLNKDHMALRDKLNSTATGVSAPSPATAPADLAALSGDAFDTRVLTLLREGHERSVARYTEASNNAALSDDVRMFATQTLPTLKEHLEKVKAAQE